MGMVNYNIYNYMNNFSSITKFGKLIPNTKDTKEFMYIIGYNVNDIILFDEGSDELLEQGRIILPRNYKIFIGNKNGEIQFKPYEFDPYRIVVTTYNDIIYTIDSIG